MSRDAKEWVLRPTLSCRKIDRRGDTLENLELQAESRWFVRVTVIPGQGHFQSSLISEFFDPSGSICNAWAWFWNRTPQAASVIRGLLFDAAGTLIEPSEPVAATYLQVFRSYGWEVGEDLLREAFGRIFESKGSPQYGDYDSGNGAEVAWWRDVVFSTMRECGIEGAGCCSKSEACFDDLFAHYADVSAWSVFPEVGEVIRSAEEAGFRMGVVSNFDQRLHRILAGAGLGFDFVLTSADAGCRKPQASIFLQALDHLGLEAREVMHCGDSREADQEGARSVGIIPFLVDRPQRDLQAFLNTAVLWCRK